MTYTLNNNNLWKVAEDGLIAHIYEHIACRYIEGQFYKEEFFSVIDYSLWGRTYGTTCFIEISTFSSTVLERFNHSIVMFASSELSREGILRAVNECACEYCRPIAKLDLSMLENSLTLLHNSQWQPFANFNVEQAKKTSSVNTLFKNASIVFKGQNTSEFSPMIIEYTIDSLIIKNNPALKALAIILIQAVALNFNTFLCHRLTCFDDGDQWSMTQDSAMYRVAIISPSDNALTNKIAASVYKDFTSYLNNSQFKVKLQHVLYNTYAQNPELMYFDWQTLNDITDGIVIGGAGWRNISTEENISKIFKSINVTFNVQP